MHDVKCIIPVNKSFAQAKYKKRHQQAACTKFANFSIIFEELKIELEHLVNRLQKQIIKRKTLLIKLN